MDAFEAALLGIVQGLTEFFPVSSSGHLVIVETLLGRVDESIVFEIAVHVGTLFAILVHYRQRVAGLVSGTLRLEPESLTYAGKLERPLLILHGTADDNVYFAHSLKLADALFKAGKRFEVLPLPGFTHMVRDPLVTRRLYERILDHFDRHLKAGAD